MNPMTHFQKSPGPKNIMADIPVTIEDITERTNTNEQKTYYSQFHVLVSSNVRTNDLATANGVADCLKTGFAKAFRDRPTEVFRFQNGGSWTSDFIDGMNIKYAAEIGHDPKGGRVHIHALVNVTHHTNIQIDYKQIQIILRQYCMDDPNIKNIFVRVKWIPTSKPLEDYIGKNPLSQDELDRN
jgi:hypothetical protein